MTHRAFPRAVLILILCVIGSAARGQDPRAKALSNSITLAEQFTKQVKYREAAAEYAKARGLAVQLYGANHINIAAFAQAEGLLQRQLGDFAKAEQLIGQVLKIAEAARDYEFIAEALNNLAAVKWEQAAYLEAQTLHERGLQQLIRIYGERSAEAAISRGNLAGVYKALGEFTRAEALMLQSVQTLRTHQPKYALELANGLMNLADLYTGQGEYPRSERLLLESIQIKERAMGSNHHEVARTRNNLAAHYSNMGQYEKAAAMQKQILANLESSLGPEHPDVARILTNLAIAYQQLKRYAEAETFYQRALAIRHKTVGKEHPDTALLEHNMAAFYTVQKNYSQAMALYENSLAIRKKTLGPDHPTVSYSLMALGQLEYQQGRPDAARQRFDEALQIREQKLSENHPDLAYAHSALGELDQATKRWESSVAHFDLARRGYRKHVDQVLPSLSEAEQLLFLRHTEEPHFHAALSLVLAQPENPSILEHSASWVLNGKAVAQQALAQRALMARDTTNPQLAEVVKALLILRKQLASLTMTSEAKEPDATRQARIAELSKQEQAQAQKLAQQGARSLGSGAWMELKQVRQALSANSVLIEIARFKYNDQQNPILMPMIFRNVTLLGLSRL